jgi:hypothetical protein
MADIDKTPDTILPKTAQKLLLTTSVNVYIFTVYKLTWQKMFGLVHI